MFFFFLLFVARNEKLGKESLSKLVKELNDKPHFNILFHQLDITDRNSCERFASYLKKEHGGLDVLVNNAGFAFKVFKYIFCAFILNRAVMQDKN